jgi:soluble lytic murein transglycosylase-like protein
MKLMGLRLPAFQRLLIIGVLSAVAVPGAADMYAYVDGNGIKHVSNTKVDSRYKLVMRTPKYRKPNPKSRAVRAQKIYRAKSKGKPFSINEANRKRYAKDITTIARKYRLDPKLLHAVISAESGFNPRAVSPAGAMGLMQLMPATARRFGVNNPYDPIANMHGGARYLRLLLNQFNNLNLALAAYNAGENAVVRYGNKIPPYKETRTYVARVRDFYKHYRR